MIAWMWSRSWGQPAVTALVGISFFAFICLLTFCEAIDIEIPEWFSYPVYAYMGIFAVLLLMLPVWLVIRTVGWIRRRQWGACAMGWGSSITCVAVLGAGAFGCVFCSFFLGAMAESSDDFADGITIPQGVEFVYPRKMTFFENEEFAAQVEPLRAAKPQLPALPEPGDATAPNLMKLSREAPELLQEYMLRCLYAEAVNSRFTAHVLQSCVMPVHEDDPQAYFRSISLTDTYGNSDGHSAVRKDTPQGRWCMPLENGWSIAVRKPEFSHMGEEVKLDFSADVACLDASLAAFAQSPTQEYLDSILPALPDTPFVCLWADDGDGAYVMLMVIPADFPEGSFELRAHEYTTGKKIRFRRDFLPEKKLGSRCRVICSDRWNIVYSGDWGEYYGSTWEIWFTPAAGGEPRRVSSQNFLMMGWQH